ncbi:ABC transporter permease [Curvibacter sp. HBC61]|uniref:ABC transporter permease n=1 Tax=Curvibacter cyanobacteriorum TaxID=3026422 RepID=A0ABT5MZN6_9BURK|nr:ABC transporter permease [Curvibacter sp. HBC61]MDD0839330.1 ABC transporter permease [Curvibacter sp. HBC61]
MNREPSPFSPAGQLTAVWALACWLLCASQPLLWGEAPEGGTAPALWWWQQPWALLAWGLGTAAAVGGLRPSRRAGSLALAGLSALAALAWLQLPPAQGAAAGAAGFWLGVLALAGLAWLGIQRCAALQGHASDGVWAPLLFGAWVLYAWQLLTVALDVPRVLLPAPALVLEALWLHSATLGGDFVQTVVKAVLLGWVLGSGLGFGVAVAIDRLPFLQRGLLPLASLSSTVPLVGVAPIAVMWFGFDWPSKVAVVVLMTFFPMLVSTLAGLQSAGRLERELMHSYAASYGRTLWSLRLPAAAPFVVGALKVNATLALIGAIVAEFFGSPTLGLGFRISTESARMNMSLVWAAITVAALTGSLAYALLVRLERRVAFWHPSVRST